VYDGSFTAKVREQFTVLVTKASKQFLTGQVNDRLKTALGAGVAAPSEQAPASGTLSSEQIAEADLDRDTEIETTLEELEGYQIVKAIACSEVKPQRIVHRDQKSYFAILIDDNNRKPIARLHFNTKQKYLGLLDEAKIETRHTIDGPDDIYEHAAAIREAVQRYL
jgi:predicted type IV restriction endonuclease